MNVAIILSKVTKGFLDAPHLCLSYRHFKKCIQVNLHVERLTLIFLSQEE